MKRSFLLALLAGAALSPFSANQSITPTIKPNRRKKPKSKARKLRKHRQRMQKLSRRINRKAA